MSIRITALEKELLALVDPPLPPRLSTGTLMEQQVADPAAIDQGQVDKLQMGIYKRGKEYEAFLKAVKADTTAWKANNKAIIAWKNAGRLLKFMEEESDMPIRSFFVVS